MYPSIIAAGGKLSAKQAAVDGEIVAMGKDARPSSVLLGSNTERG
jgi:hypothetical protein